MRERERETANLGQQHHTVCLLGKKQLTEVKASSCTAVINLTNDERHAQARLLTSLNQHTLSFTHIYNLHASSGLYKWGELAPITV